MSNTLDFPFELKLAEEDAPPGTIKGYGSVFGIMDRGGDIMMPGAFKKSLTDWRKRKEMPSMLWSHDTAMPIGVWTSMVEDENGLKVQGELILDIKAAADAYTLLKRKAVKGLSIGYRTKQSEVDRTTGARRLKEVDLWELSLVTIPMLPEAQISNIKSEFDAPFWEKAFREVGLSIREAKAATAVARKLSLREGEPTGEDLTRDGVTDLLLNLRRFKENMR